MDKDLLLEVADLIQKIILVRLPVVSLLRFKSVCKSWCALIQSPSFIHLHTTFNSSSSSSSSSSSRFGSFILHAAVDSEERRFREDAVFMLSSVSESSESSEYCVSRSGSWCSGSFGLWSTGFNGLCGRCDPGSGSPNDGLCGCCGKWNSYRVADDQVVLKLENLGFPSCYNFGKINVMVVGSCNGLICLHDSERRDVSLWNPATRQFRILPKSPSSITTIAAATAAAGDGNVHRLFAFGFDDKTKDYKVVLLSVSSRRRMLDFVIKDEPTAPMECVCRVEVYSSSTNSWKLLKGITSLPGSPFPYPPDSSSSELFYLNGSCFFMAKLLYSSSEEQCSIPPPPPKNDDRFMISLDLTNEIITPIEFPYHHYHQMSLSYLGKKIALFMKGVYREVHDSTCSWEGFRMLVFNEDSSVSGDEPWAYLGFFQIKLDLPGERNIPRGLSNDAVFVLLETEIRGGLGSKKKKLKLYNLITKELKENFLSCDQVLSKAFPYKPSLVSIIGPV